MAARRIQDINDTKAKHMKLFPITASMSKNHPMEKFHQINPELKSNDDFIENLFIHRAYWNQPDKKEKMIVGDRSILTSYVSRWMKWSDPFYTIRKVENQYKGIMKPDVLIWLETPVETASRNIRKRKQKEIRKSDEAEEKLITDKLIYDELIAGNLYKKKIENVEIIILENTIPKEVKEELVDDVLQIMNVYVAKMNGLRRYKKKDINKETNNDIKII
jgi:thymidylate kinase